MDYKQSVEILQNLCRFGINLGLERIKKLLALLGHPEQKIKTIHIAGSNGKGSTASILMSILMESGLKVGGYTSPHLHSYRERIRINNQEIPSEKFAFLMERLNDLLPQVLQNIGEAPTEFEVLTALAFQYFYEEKVDIAIIEVGMGGRLDSTNVLLPQVAVITPISEDHLEFLGPGILDIAREKAGILKKNIPVVIAQQREEVEAFLIKEAQRLKAPIIRAQDALFKQLNYDSQRQSLSLKTKEKFYPKLELSLLGDHQLQNATTAICTIEAMNDLGYQIPLSAIEIGLKKASWPGRLEYLSTSPAVLFDGAHNPEGAKALALALPKYFSYQRIILVIAILDDKNKQEILNYLLPLAQVVVVTKVPNSLRNYQWQEIAELIPESVNKVYLEENYQLAFDLAYRIGRNEDLLLVTGSLYLLGVMREYVLKKYPPA